MTLRRQILVNPEREHRQRLERWYARLRALPSDADDLVVVDYALVVLQQCDSMRDWLHGARKIKTDRDLKRPSRSSKSVETTGIPESDVEALFDRHELQVCKAIVDGAKHLKLDRKHLDNEAVTDIPMPDFRRGGPVDLHPVFVVAGKHYRVLDLCTSCVMLIRGFFKAHGDPGPMMHTVPDLVRGRFLTIPNHEGTPWP